MAREYDEVNRPAHYASGRIECIEAIEAALTPEELKGFLKGNIIKYTWRERHKGGVQSLAKAQWYLNRLLGTDLAPPVTDKPLPQIQDLPKTLGAALGLKDDLDAYDKVEAYYSKRGFEQ
jgi:hypothetical protein